MALIAAHLNAGVILVATVQSLYRPPLPPPPRGVGGGSLFCVICNHYFSVVGVGGYITCVYGASVHRRPLWLCPDRVGH